MSECLACGSSSNTLVLQKEDIIRKEGVVSLYKCDTVFVDGYEDGFFQEFYDYYTRYENMSKKDAFDPISTKRYEELLQKFESSVSGKRLLDVGCGIGHFVETAIDYGWKAEGLELSAPAVDFAARNGIPVHPIDFFSDSITPESFDVLTMFELIEHVSCPRNFLKKAEEVVVPGGLVYITTPNFNSIDRRVLGAKWDVIHRAHLSYFTPKTLKSLVRNSSSLEVVNISTKNISSQALGEIKKALKGAFHQCYGTSGGETNDPIINKMKTLELRKSIERSTIKRWVKGTVNHCINWCDAGISMVVLLRKKQ
jgi:2-polyprenyl-3-methyl-5-hydroxy-6-metoxy-1,4-benzoquinol methylase